MKITNIMNDISVCLLWKNNDMEIFKTLEDFCDEYKIQYLTAYRWINGIEKYPSIYQFDLYYCIVDGDNVHIDYDRTINTKFKIDNLTKTVKLE